MVLFEFDYQKAHPEVSSLSGMGEYIAASQGNGELGYNKRIDRKFLIPYGLNTLLDSNMGTDSHSDSKPEDYMQHIHVAQTPSRILTH